LAIVTLLTSGVVCGFLYLNSDLEELRAKKDHLEQVIAHLKERTGEVAQLQSIRSAVRQQLARVAVLKEQRWGPVHLLDDLNRFLPDRAWITSISQKSDKLTVVGMALDNRTISEFMVKLGESKVLAEVDLTESRQADFAGVKVQGFTIRATTTFVGRVVRE
jgi:type IV pilus assembly protein PilN